MDECFDQKLSDANAAQANFQDFYQGKKGVYVQKHVHTARIFK